MNPPDQQPTGGEISATQANRVSTKVPPFWKPDPRIWFLQLEAQFRNNQVKLDQTKFDIVVSSIDAQILAQIADLLINPPDENKYDTLKGRLISVFADSETTKTRRLLTELELGDNKPSQLLCQMKSLADNKIDDSFLRTLWLQRLPDQMKAILSGSSDELPKLASMADKIWELSPAQPFQVTAIDQEDSELKALSRQVHELSIQVDKLTKRMSSRTSRSRSRDRASTSTKCWYHEKFGDRARRCLQPCSMTRSQSTKTEEN